MTKILISEIRHCIGIIKTGDIKGGTQRLSQLADNLQHFNDDKVVKPARQTNSVYQGSHVAGSLDDNHDDA